jgi:hypothetical protein
MGRLIGSSGQYSTWACVRSSMWKGTGYRDQTLPNNKNKSEPTVPSNYIIVDNLGRLSVAFPFTKGYTGGANYYESSMSLGLDYVFDSFSGEISLYLCHGQGIRQGPSGTDGFEQVIGGYVYGTSGSSSWSPTAGTVGYDTPRTRLQYIGGVVNVTFTPGPEMDEVTEDVTITEDLFPDNLDFSGNGNGIYIGTYTWPSGWESMTWDQPYWTINSLTMPT